jgi:hypothetical protein
MEHINFRSLGMTSEKKETFGSTLQNIVLGIFLFFASFPLLWWNEGRTIHRMETLLEGEKIVIPLSLSSIQEQNNGKLVHFSGHADSPFVVKDPLFGIEVKALKLVRIVEMYQWIETKHEKEGKPSDYSYSRDWSEEIHKSQNFDEPNGHQNPTSKPFQNETWVANPIQVGPFTLSQNLINMLTDYTAYPLTDETFKHMSPNLQQRLPLQGPYYQSSKNPEIPEIGDVRISFTIIPPQEVSVLGKQQGNHITGYSLKKDKIEDLKAGNYSAQDMFDMLHQENAIEKWLYRLLGYILAFMGLRTVLRPLTFLSERIPVVGQVLVGGVGFFSSLIALITSSITIALAWLAYRPAFSIPILSLCLFFSVYLGVLTLQKRQKPVPIQPDVKDS